MYLCIIGYPAQPGEQTPGPRAVLAATSVPIVADLVSRIMHMLATTDWIRPPRRSFQAGQEAISGKRPWQPTLRQSSPTAHWLKYAPAG